MLTNGTIVPRHNTLRAGYICIAPPLEDTCMSTNSRNTLRRPIPAFILVFWLTLACSFGGVVATPAPGETPILPTTETTASPATPAPSATPTGPAVLLFTIGMHIEPLGVTHQGLPSGKGADYLANAQFFQKHVQDIQKVAAAVEAHGGRMTIQAQSPFTDAAIAGGNAILA